MNGGGLELELVFKSLNLHLGLTRKLINGGRRLSLTITTGFFHCFNLTSSSVFGFLPLPLSFTLSVWV
ncbi:hypothetical protein SDJN03_27792, partial [Cucurbita argyrosperma subsp. sororia]